jgi:hypothetical protein
MRYLVRPRQCSARYYERVVGTGIAGLQQVLAPSQLVEHAAALICLISAVVKSALRWRNCSNTSNRSAKQGKTSYKELALAAVIPQRPVSAPLLGVNWGSGAVYKNIECLNTTISQHGNVLAGDGSRTPHWAKCPAQAGNVVVKFEGRSLPKHEARIL